MRINIYSQELTSEVLLVTKSDVQVVEDRDRKSIYSAVRFMLHSSERLHHAPHDDDRSAVTFWLPKGATQREKLAQAFERAAEYVREAPEER